jgi:hypothetical protein
MRQPSNSRQGFARGLPGTRLSLLLMAGLTGLVGAGCGPERGVEHAPARPLAEQSATLVSAGANPTVRPRFTWVPATTPPATHWVNNVTGDDNRATPTASAPWKTIHKAITTAPAGAVIYVQNSGTPYQEHVRLERSGSPSAPFILVGVPHGTNAGLPEWRDATGTGGHQVRFSASYWIVKGFIFDKSNSTHNGCVTLAAVSSNNALLEVECRNARGSPGEQAIFVSGADNLVRKCKSHDNRATNCTDNCDIHGFMVGQSAKRVVLQQNESWNNSGDGLQCSGSDASATLVDPEDIWIEDNRFHHNREQGIDIKSCNRVTITGTAAVDGSKVYGGKDAAGTGAAMVLHYKARNILIEKTRFWDNGQGIGIGRDNVKPGVIVHDVQNVVIRRNVFFDFVSDTTTKKDGFGIQLFKVSNVDIYHNTFDNLPGGGVYVGFGAYTGNTANASSNVRVWNNIFRNNELWAIHWRSAYGPGFSSSHNLFYRSSGGAIFRIDDVTKNFTEWRQGTSQDTIGSSEKDPQFVADPRSNDYFTLSTSPARNTALDDSGQPRPCSGTQAPPDIGFKESCN